MLQTLSVDESYQSPSPAVFFLNKQRHVNNLQPRDMTVGQVSFISALEWNKHVFTPHTTPSRDHQCCLTWIPFSEIGHNMHTDPSVFVFPVKILRISVQFCSQAGKVHGFIRTIQAKATDSDLLKRCFLCYICLWEKTMVRATCRFFLFLFLITVICTWLWKVTSVIINTHQTVTVWLSLNND